MTQICFIYFLHGSLSQEEVTTQTDHSVIDSGLLGQGGDYHCLVGPLPWAMTAELFRQGPH